MRPDMMLPQHCHQTDSKQAQACMVCRTRGGCLRWHEAKGVPAGQQQVRPAQALLTETKALKPVVCHQLPAGCRWAGAAALCQHREAAVAQPVLAPLPHHLPCVRHGRSAAPGHGSASQWTAHTHVCSPMRISNGAQAGIAQEVKNMPSAIRQQALGWGDGYGHGHGLAEQELHVSA